MLNPEFLIQLLKLETKDRLMTWGDLDKLLADYKKLAAENGIIRFTYTDDEYGEFAKELHAKCGIPKFAYDGDAGFDLPVILSKENQVHGYQKIWPHERDYLHTGIICEFPLGFHGRIIHRSSCEKIHRLRVIEGIIDDYRGEILIQVANQNPCHVEVRHGHKLAQLVVLPSCGFKIEYAPALRPSERGARGFGSSGK